MTPSPLRSGKVREIYDAGEHLILVSSDRISAFDCILPTLIPDKGKVLSTLSVFWFNQTREIITNHIISDDVREFPAPFSEMKDWQGRALLVRRARVLPIECVVRGYLAGSGWKDYAASGQICGVTLPAGLRESEQLPEPIFTPTTKEELGAGHDMPVSFEHVVRILGTARAEQVRSTSLELYRFAVEFARERGMIIADTKFEFGLVGEELILIDEIFTPDSSRFWDEQEYSAGRSQDSFDKQFVRDYLETLDWNKTPPAPELPPNIVEQTAAKYQEAYERLTGQKWR